MVTAIILIADRVEQATLGDRLRDHNPELTIHPVVTDDDLGGLDPAILPKCRIIGFSTNVLVPPSMIAAAGWGAINFHPGPPAYPGWAPAAFAIHDGATRFGATAHVMTEHVDGGPIIDVEMFDVPAESDMLALEKLAYAASARQFFRLSMDLSTRADPLPVTAIPWGSMKCSRKAYARLCDIAPDIAPRDLERRIRACKMDGNAPRPSVTIHGYRFRLDQGMSDEKRPAVAGAGAG